MEIEREEKKRWREKRGQRRRQEEREMLGCGGRCT